MDAHLPSANEIWLPRRTEKLDIVFVDPMRLRCRAKGKQ